MYISLKGIGNIFSAIIKLFIIGIIMILLFKIAMVLLPIALIGFVTIYAINYFHKRKDDEVEIVE